MLHLGRLGIALIFVVSVWISGPLMLQARANDPVVDIARLMDSHSGASLRFYDGAPRLMVSDLTLVFRPGDEHNTTVDIIKAGTVDPVATLDFFPGYQGSNTVFGDVRPKGPGIIDLPGPGVYILNVNVGGKTASAFPFSVVEEGSDDPFSPDKKYHYRGAWEHLAYLKESKRFTDRPIQVNIWASGLDVEEGGKGQLVVKLLKDDEMIARNKRYKSINKRSKIWGLFSLTLHEPVDNPNAPGFNFEKLLSDDDEYKIVVEVDGKVVREFEFEVDDGEIEVSGRSVMDHEPRTEYLPPRTIDLEQRGQSLYKPVEIFWLEAERD